MNPYEHDPYQPDHSGVTEHYAHEHSPWRTFLQAVGWYFLLAWLTRRFPWLGRPVVLAIGVLLVVGFVYVVYRMHTSPENQPVHTNYGN